MDIPFITIRCCKLITYGETREEAIQIMIKAIEEYQVEGVRQHCLWEICFEHEAFRSGKFDTHFVKNYYNADVLKKQMAKEPNSSWAMRQYFEDQKNNTGTELKYFLPLRKSKYCFFQMRLNL
jgi:propionyl-CoA carboxylase alpha chain